MRLQRIARTLWSQSTEAKHPRPRHVKIGGARLGLCSDVKSRCLAGGGPGLISDYCTARIAALREGGLPNRLRDAIHVEIYSRAI
jgi:hypothetical protein